MKYGLVLEGGGVRGAFHIGVWMALRKMGIELSAVVGTSIGAVNGALIAQNEYDTAVRLWRSIAAGDVVSLPKGIDSKSDIFRVENIKSILVDLYKNSGVSIQPLEDLLRTIIDEDKIRNSDIDFGLTMYSLSDKEGIYKFADEIPRGELISHIVASASILGTKRINSDILTDGGMYDNLPVNMLLSRGIDNIIVVTVGGIGVKRGYSTAGKNIISIKPTEALTGIMNFDHDGITRAIDEGYTQCLKAFAYAMGEIYCFGTDDYVAARKIYSKELIGALEKAAEFLGVNKLELYTVDGLREIVLGRYYAAVQSNKSPLVMAVESIENNEPMREKGDLYDAASAIVYFKKGISR